jgi:hypothetical protein
VAGRAEALGRDGVAKLAELLLCGGTLRRRLDDLGAEALATEPGVLLGLRAAELMVYVESVYAVAEGSKCMPQAGRVGAPRDQAEHFAAGSDEVVPADVLLDSRT